MTRTKRPLDVGEEVGHKGRHARISRIDPSTWSRVEIRYTGPVQIMEWVWISELTDPPPLPDRITEHVPALAEFLGNPRSIFDEEG